MNRFSAGVLCVPLFVLVLGGCDNGARARLIETYRAANFASSRSDVTRSAVLLTTTFDLGYAYEVTSRRLEYAPVPEDSAPPIDDRGELVSPSFASVEDPTLTDENGDPVPGRRNGGVLEARLPARVLRSGDLYYRWVLEYSSGSNQLTMRKSDIFRTHADREARQAEDERVGS